MFWSAVEQTSVAINDKPIAAASSLNPWAPRPDKLGLALPVNDATSGRIASGEQLNAFGNRHESYTGDWPVNQWSPTVYSTSDGPQWNTVEGGGLEFRYATDAIKLHECSGEAIVIPRGTVVLRASFSSSSLSGAPVFVLGDGTTGLRLRITNSRMRVTKVENSVLEDVFLSDELLAYTRYTWILSWGEQGMRFYDGAAWQTDASTFGPTLNDGALSTLMGIYIGGWLYITEGVLHAFAHYDWQPTQAELDELIVDPYLYMRERAATTHFETAVNPVAGRAKTNQFTLSTCTGANVADDENNRVYLRCLYGEQSDLSDASVSDTATGITPLSRLNLTVNDLSASVYYWLAQYRIGDAGNWTNFPGGRGRVSLQKTSGSFRFAVVSDLHVNDITYAALGSETAQFLTPTNRTNYGLSRMMQDIREQNVDFVIDVGDSTYGVQLNQERRTCHRIQRNFLNPLYKSGAYYLALGNWEDEAGYKQRAGSQKASFNERLRFVLNPDGDTYAEGGEAANSMNDWIPALGTVNRDNEIVDQEYLDTLIHDSGAPLENYYAWTWGDALFVVLDPYRYTDLSENGTNADEEAPWQLGGTQWTWLEQVLATSTARWKFIILHQFLGGHKTGQGWYGRGSGIHISAERMKRVQFGTVEQAMSEEEQLAQAGTVGIAEELRLHRYARQHHVTAIIKGHDHQFGHAIKETVNYLSACPPWAWFAVGTPDSYGKPELLGSDKAADGLQHGNILCGYLLCEVSPNTCTMRMRYVVEHCNAGAYANQNVPGFIGKHLSEPMDTIEAGWKVVLPTDELPKNVFAVCNDDDGDFVKHVDPRINRLMQFAAANLAAFDKFTGYGAVRWDEPWNSSTVFLEDPATEQVRADWIPREIYVDYLRNARAAELNLRLRRALYMNRKD